MMIGDHQRRTEDAAQRSMSLNSFGGSAYTCDEKATQALWQIAHTLAAIADELAMQRKERNGN